MAGVEKANHYIVRVRNARTNYVELYRTASITPFELELSLFMFKVCGYEIISAIKEAYAWQTM